jgi:hypothetical protein
VSTSNIADETDSIVLSGHEERSQPLQFSHVAATFVVVFLWLLLPKQALSKVFLVRPNAHPNAYLKASSYNLIGIDRSFLAEVERGTRNISILNLALIAKGLGVSLSQLFSRL